MNYMYEREPPPPIFGLQRKVYSYIFGLLEIYLSKIQENFCVYDALIKKPRSFHLVRIKPHIKHEKNPNKQADVDYSI